MRSALCLASVALVVAVVAPKDAVAQYVVTPPTISGRTASGPDPILPADVLARVQLAAAEVEHIRFVMGRPRAKTPRLTVVGSAPHTVWFSALTAFHKANRLCFEHTGYRAAPPPVPPPDRIGPADVWKVANLALTRILLVKRELGIRSVANERLAPTTARPDQVLATLLRLNQQLNLLLERRISASDVYMEVTRAVHICARLLARFPGAPRMAEAPAFTPGKVPADVMRRLVATFDVVREIATHSGLSMCKVSARIDAEVVPSEVYAAAQLLVAELSYIAQRAGELRNVVPVHYPGRRFPAHVFQRARRLKAQLSLLRVRVDSDPGWIGRARVGANR